MNCQSCDTRIDYRFLTRCSHCDAEIRPSPLPTQNTAKDLCLAKPVAKAFTWFDGVINLAFVAVSSVAGMFSGAIALYFSGAIVYIVFAGHSGNNESHDCALGNAIGMMSIFLGALLGLTAGIVFAARNLPRKPAVR